MPDRDPNTIRNNARRESLVHRAATGEFTQPGACCTNLERFLGAVITGDDSALEQVKANIKANELMGLDESTDTEQRVSWTVN